MAERGWRWFRGTLVGAVLGVVALVAWVATFDPHGGREFSLYLFPLSRWTLAALYPNQSIPPLLWFGGAFVQWLLLGFIFDIVVALRHARRNTTGNN
ncbi:hypothetical protein AYO44_12255 [Planctomycetaceae bacterium SCGC AG-212-F19]|nr:hypothetical protein AYO44_12255 [Planctomycetaceae bacterium SCGC AG-212-F19]